MTSYTGFSPQSPNRYLAPNLYLSTIVTRQRQPTGADYRQPENGKIYPIGSFWIVAKDPTNGSQGDLWYLSKITANVAFWVMLSAGGGGLEEFVVDSVTAPGVNPVSPLAGLITFNGRLVAAQSIPVQSYTIALNQMGVEVQIASTSVASDITQNGSSHFNDAQFTLDADGFVSLKGGSVGAVLSFNVDTSTPPGTDPVIADGSGIITITGAQVAAGVVGANVLRSNSVAVNTFRMEIQRSTAVSSSASINNGVCHFNSAHFNVDSNGFVSSNNTISQWLDVSGAVAGAVDTGYFVTGTCTLTLPSSPLQGDLINCIVDTTQILTIQANTGQFIRVANNLTSSAGTTFSSQQGDSMELVYRAATTTWMGRSNPNGAWTYT